MAKEKVSIEVLIETSKSAKGIKELSKSVADLNTELQVTESTDDSFIKLSEAVDVANASMNDLVLTTNNAELTLSQLKIKQDELNNSLLNVDRGTEEFKRLKGELISVGKELGNAELGLVALNSEGVAGEVGKLTGAVGSLSSSFILLGGSSGGTIEEIGASIQTAIGITEGFKGAIEGVEAGKKLWQNYSKAVNKSAIGTKLMAVAQAALNFVMNLNPVFLLIAAFTALIALFVVFAASSNKAEKQTEKLNRALQNQKKDYENLVEVLDEVADARKTELANNAKLLESQKKLILSKGKLTEADKKRLTEIDASLSQIKLEGLDLVIETAESKFAGLRTQLNTTFLAIISSLNATDFEDGWNDISYDKLLETNDKLYTSFVRIQREGFTDENIDKQIKNIQKLRAEQQNFNKTLVNSNAKLGEAEQEQFSKTLEASEEQEELFDKLIANATDYKNALTDKSGALQIDKDTDAIEENEKAAEEAAKAEEKRIEANAKAAEQKLKDAEDEKQRLLDLAQLKEETYQDGFKTEEELTLRQLELEYKANQARAEALLTRSEDEEELAKLLGEIRENYTSEVNKINEDATKVETARLKEIENLNKQTLDNIQILELEKELVQADAIKDEIEREKEKNRILDALDKARLSQLKTNLDIDLQNDELSKDEKIELQKKYNLEVAKINTEAQKHNNEVELEEEIKQGDLRKMLKEAGFQIAQQLADAAFQIAAENRQRDLDNELEQLEENFSAEEEQLNRQVELGIKTQKQADRERLKLDKERAKEEDKLNREAFKKNKDASKKQAIINGALAITKALTSVAPPASYILAATTAISTGIQIAAISSQKYARGGVLKGASHANGGIQTPFGELEGGEVIINKNSSNLFRNELSAINEAGGGVKFAAGGVLNATNQNAQTELGLNGTLERLNLILKEPIRSYVVSDEITTAQNRNAQLDRNANI